MLIVEFNTETPGYVVWKKLMRKKPKRVAAPYRRMNRVSVKPERLTITVIVCQEGILHVRQSCAVIDRARAISGVTN